MTLDGGGLILGGGAGLQGPAGGDDAAEFVAVADGIEVAIAVEVLEAEAGAKRGGEQLECLGAVLGMFARRKGVHSGELKLDRRTTIARERFLSLLHCLGAPVQTRQ